eukprot:1156492-Pelagomonas_calceolata.AAC.3
MMKLWFVNKYVNINARTRTRTRTRATTHATTHIKTHLCHAQADGPWRSIRDRCPEGVVVLAEPRVVRLAADARKTTQCTLQQNQGCAKRMCNMEMHDLSIVRLGQSVWVGHDNAGYRRSSVTM